MKKKVIAGLMVLGVLAGTYAVSASSQEFKELFVEGPTDCSVIADDDKVLCDKTPLVPRNKGLIQEARKSTTELPRSITCRYYGPALRWILGPWSECEISTGKLQ